jgi:NADPH:quinone reductase-like Zn-dependent oxidoreductase
MPAQTANAWVLDDQKGIDSLRLVESGPIPDLGDSDVLVKLHAASLNYRDLVIAKVSYLDLSYYMKHPHCDTVQIIRL